MPKLTKEITHLLMLCDHFNAIEKKFKFNNNSTVTEMVTMINSFQPIGFLLVNNIAKPILNGNGLLILVAKQLLANISNQMISNLESLHLYPLQAF